MFLKCKKKRKTSQLWIYSDDLEMVKNPSPMNNDGKHDGSQKLNVSMEFEAFEFACNFYNQFGEFQGFKHSEA